MLELKVVEEADAEPVTLAEIKDYCHLDEDDFAKDLTLSLLASSARQLLEKELNLSLAIQTLEVTFVGYCVRLPQGPILEILSVEIDDVPYDTYALHGDLLTLTDYIDHDNVIIYPVGYRFNPMVKVTYMAGYTALPAPLKHAILLQLDYDIKGQGEETLEDINPSALKKASPYSKNLYIQ